MEESSNGKVEEILKEESEVKERKDVDDDGSEAVKVTVIDGKSESVEENNYGGGDSSSSSSSDEEEAKVEDEKSSTVLDSGELEEEGKAVDVSVVEAIASAVEEVSEDVTEVKNKETDEILKEISDVSEEVVSALPPLSDGVSEIISKAIEEVKLPSSDDNSEASVPVTVPEEEIKETKDLKQNIGEPSNVANLESKEKVEESLQESTDSGNVEKSSADAYEIVSKREITGSNDNQVSDLSSKTALFSINF